MQIISHRGFWNLEIQPNSIIAFENALANNFGIEFDIRDLDGQIVVAHDIPLKANNHLTLDQFFKLYKSFNNDLPLAVNIKSDGLQNQLKELIEKYKITNYFLFDMSVPDAITHYKKGITEIYSRQSDYEKSPAFYEIAKGIWMDEFNEEWISKEVLENHLKNNKKIAIVSPELHKKNNYLTRWEFYKKLDFGNSLAICTDYPDKAKEFFNNK